MSKSETTKAGKAEDGSMSRNGSHPLAGSSPAPATNSKTTNTLALAKQIEQKAIEALAPMQAAMDKQAWPDDLRIILWEAIARKANTYAARCT